MRSEEFLIMSNKDAIAAARKLLYGVIPVGAINRDEYDRVMTILKEWEQALYLQISDNYTE